MLKVYREIVPGVSNYSLLAAILKLEAIAKKVYGSLKNVNLSSHSFCKLDHLTETKENLCGISAWTILHITITALSSNHLQD